MKKSKTNATDQHPTAEFKKIQYLSNVLTEIAPIILIILISWNYVSGLQEYIDIKLADETIYLYNGCSLMINGMPDPAWSPLYSVWYFMLSVIQSDRVLLYYLNYKLLTILPGVLIYILLRSISVRKVIALLCCLLFLYSAANLYVWPKVFHFSLCILLIFLIITLRIKPVFVKLSVMVLGTLVLSYIRPEFILSYFILILILVIHLVRNPSGKKLSRWLILIGLIFTFIILVFSFGFPLDSENKRDQVAFNQHFALNWVRWNNSTLSPWKDADIIIEKTFGQISNPLGALISNPRMFNKHILSNLKRFPIEIFRLYTRPAMVYLYPVNRAKYITGFILILIGTLYLLLKNASLREIKDNIKNMNWLFWVVFAYLVPSFISIIILYPRPHYLIIPVIIVGLSSMICIDKNRNPVSNSFLYYVIIASVFLILTPDLERKSPRVIVSTIEYIKSLDIKQQVNLLEADYGYTCYLDTNYHWIRALDKKQPFNQFFNSKNIDCIVLSEKLLNDSRMINDETWLNFINSYDNYGFIKYQIPGASRSILLKRELTKKVDELNIQ